MKAGPQVDLNGSPVHLKRDAIRRVFLTDHRIERGQPFPAPQVSFRGLSLPREVRPPPEAI
jgi:hypothetical protein